MSPTHPTLRIPLLLLLLVAAAATPPLSAGIVETVLLPNPGDDETLFGDAVAIDGGVVAVGAPGDDELGEDAGALFVFEKETATGDWQLAARLTGAEAATFQELGRALALEGDRLLAGGPGDFTFGDEGGAWIFERDPASGEWLQTAHLLPSDSQDGDQFGEALTLDGDTAVVGAWNQGSGAAYVFERDPVAGAWNEVDRLVTPPSSEADDYGTAVDLDGDRLVVGASRAGDFLVTLSSAFVYDRQGDGTWALAAELKAPDGDPGTIDNFGSAVAVDGDAVAVSAPVDDDFGFDTGAVYVFGRHPNTGEWLPLRKLLPDDAQGDAWFGTAVDLRGDLLLVGARRIYGTAPDSGAGYVFGRDLGGPGRWGQIAKLVGSDTDEQDLLGTSVDLASGALALGAPGAGTSGQAYVFEAE